MDPPEHFRPERLYGEMDAELLARAVELVSKELGIEGLIESALRKLMSAHRGREAAALIVHTLPELDDCKQEYKNHLCLQLAYLLAIDLHAREIIEPDDAVPMIEEAIEHLVRFEPHDIERLATAFNNLGSVRLACTRDDILVHEAASRSAYNRSMDLFERGGEQYRARSARILVQRARLYLGRTSGDPAKNIELANEYACRALKLLEQLGDPAGRALAHSCCGSVLLSQLSGSALTNSFGALRHFNCAAALWEQTGKHGDLLEEWINIGIAEREIGLLYDDVTRLELSASHFERVHAEADAKHLAGFVVVAQRELLVTRAELFSRTTPHLTAIEASIDMAEQLSVLTARYEPKSGWKAHAIISRLITSAAVQRSDKAMLTKAVSHAEIAVHRSRGRGARELAALYAALGDAFSTFGLTLEAERYYVNSEKAAANWLQTGLSLMATARMSQLRYRSTSARAYLEAKRDALLEAVATLDEAIGTSLVSPEHEEEFLPALAERDSLLSALEASTHTNEDELDDKIARLKELNALLQAQATVLSLSISETAEILVRSIPVRGAVLLPLFGPWGDVIVFADLPKDDDKLRLSRVDCPGLEHAVRHVLEALPASVGISTSEDAERLTEALGSLGEVLRRSLVHHLRSLAFRPAAQVRIIAHGISAVVPWHAAWWMEDGTRRFLDDECLVSAVPSLRWLASQQRRGRGWAGKGIAVIADPSGDLPGARLEAALVPDELKASKTTTLIGRPATVEATVLALNACGHAHLAMHSHFDRERPFYSGLTLSNGKLTVAELVARNGRSPKTIILSSCSSGLNDTTQLSSDRWGFPWVLHRWGVSAVIASMWDISDIAVLLLFSDFYRHEDWIHEPLAALQRARASVRRLTISQAHDRLSEVGRNISPKLREQLDIIEELFGPNAPFAHPLFWAPMCFSGLHRQGSAE